MGGIAVKLTPEEYLKLNIRPWPELVDGELRRRSPPTPTHSWIQGSIQGLLKSEGLLPFPELHVIVAAGEYRVVDIAVYESFPDGPYPATPAFATIEIVSPSDTRNDVLVKCREYLEWGVPNIWVIDPNRRTLHTYSHRGLETVELLELRDHNVRIALNDLLAGLPERD
jgi:Uma2 family endonuclease